MVNSDNSTKNQRGHTEDMFQKIFQASPDGYIISRMSDGKILQVNRSAEVIYGFTIEEMLGRTSIELGLFAYPKDREQAVSILKEKGFLRDLPLYIVRKSGEKRFVSLAVELVDLDGEQCMLTSVRDITDQKKAEEEIIARAIEIETILESITDGVIVYDNEGRIVRTNTAADEILKYPQKDLNTPMVERVSERYGVWSESGEKLKPEEMPAMRALTKGEKVRNVVTRIQGAGGQRWINVSAVPLIISGKQIGAVATMADITEKKKAADAMQLSEAQMDAFFANSPAILNLVDDNFCYINTDKFTPTYYGLNRETIKGKCVKDLSQDFIEQTGRVMQKIIETGESVLHNQFQAPVPGREGEMAYWSTSMFRVPLGNEKWGVGVISIEITDIKRAEAKLKESDEKLREAQKLAHVGSWSLDIATGKIEWSEEIFNIYELDPGKGVPPEEVFNSFWHPEDKEYATSLIRDGIENQKTVSFEACLLLPGNKNKVKHISYASKWIYDKVGMAVGRIGAIADITERKELQLQLEHTIAELEKSNKELQQFAYVASHDLQEPLRMVSNFTTLLSTRYSHCFDDKAMEYMSFIVEGSKRMSQQITDFLQFSRISTRGEAFMPTDMNKALEVALKNLESEIEESNAVIKFTNLPEINADPLQMIQLFQSFISNSIKFRSDEKPVIQINAQHVDRKWIFSVNDNGIGIESQYFEKIFIIFQRLHASRDKYPGTGIGLSLCKKIIERHGGKIWIDSEPGKGSTFYFSIPD